LFAAALNSTKDGALPGIARVTITPGNAYISTRRATACFRSVPEGTWCSAWLKIQGLSTFDKVVSSSTD